MPIHSPLKDARAAFTEQFELLYVKAPEPGQVNLPPSAGMQFFGQVDIDGASEVMTVRLKDMAGATLFTQELAPAA